MGRESKKDKRQRAAKILAKLKQMYGHAETALDWKTPWQLLVATILSAQCTDERVNMTTPALFDRFPDAASMAAADRKEIEKLIHSTGFYRNKAKSVQGASQRIVEEHDGEVPDTMDDLLALPGVARKTANCVLGNVWRRAEGVVVDTHVKRIANLLKFTTKRDPVKIEKDLMGVLPQADWIFFSNAIILHGRRVCTARKPDCESCKISQWCPSAFTFPHNKDTG